MRFRSLSISTLTFLLVSCVSQAYADTVSEEILACRQIGSIADRVQCYDRIADGLGRGRNKMPATESEKTTVVGNKPAPKPISSDSSGGKAMPTEDRVVRTPQSESEPVKPVIEDQEAMFGKQDSEVRELVEKQLEIQTLDEIRSRVVKAEQNSLTKYYVVHLENGQVWRQKSDPGKWRIKKGEMAIISTASLGSYLMKSDARKKAVKAERIR